MNPAPTPKPDPKAVARLVEGEIDLVDLLARQLRRQFGAQLPLDDLRSAGHEGLVQAARSFDETLGVRFRSWANVRVKGAMIDSLRREGAVPRMLQRRLAALAKAEQVLEAHAENGVSHGAQEADASLETLLGQAATALAIGLASRHQTEGEEIASAEPSAERELERRQIMELLTQLIAEQPDPDRTVIEQVYLHERSLESVGQSLGLSRSWVCRLHARAIETLSKRLKERL